MTTPFAGLVQLHYASVDLLNDPRFVSQALSCLSLKEHKRYQRFVNKQQADQFLLARALLRHQLSKQVPAVLPCEWVIVVDDNGKPRLADGFSYLNLHFNLSHSEDLVVLALAEGVALGVDIECIHRPVFNLAFAKRYFAKTEFMNLAGLSQSQQIRRIAQLWTLKESYLKACGLGIRMPLAQLEFCFKDEHHLTFNAPCVGSKSLSFQGYCFFRLFDLEFNYSLALTVMTDDTVGILDMSIKKWAGLNSQCLVSSSTLLRQTAA